MAVAGAHRANLVLAILFLSVTVACDQIEDATSGGGGKESNSTQSASGTIVNDSASGEGSEAADGSDASDDASSDEENLKTFDEVLSEAGLEEEEEDSDSSDVEPEQSADPYAHRNVEQYARLPRNVTWKPISNSSGGNLTVILWGRGGGEKNYQKGTLRVEYNGGVKYPRKEEKRTDGAPRFLFDVQGGWFEGKDPVLIWNLGANRIVHPERRQGKNEE